MPCSYDLWHFTNNMKASLVNELEDALRACALSQRRNDMQESSELDVVAFRYAADA
jgi:hypothetical protein